jgi:hypothetical protein
MAGWRKSQTMTMAPSAANLSAVAKPMPWAAPVMMLTLLWSLVMSAFVESDSGDPDSSIFSLLGDAKLTPHFVGLNRRTGAK